MASPEKPAQIVSVPLPGFSGLRPHNTQSLVDFFVSFSPVAGIQWVETLLVRLPGVVVDSFSPVAGIQWVETHWLDFPPTTLTSFSPVAGIQWVETLNLSFNSS